jgi:hypothetical protein
MKAAMGSTIPAGCLVAMLFAGTCTQIAQARECSERTIEGTYAFGLEGTVQGDIGPLAASGTTTFDGEGGASITGFINTTGGDPVLEASADGTYTVNPEDCTGSATFKIPPPGLFDRFTELQFEGVIVGQGEEIRYLITTPGVVFAGSSVRQDSQR